MSDVKGLPHDHFPIEPEAVEVKNDIKFEDLPLEKQQEVIEVSEILPDNIVTKCIELEPNEEHDVYYDKVKKELSYLPVSQVQKDDNKLRIGTIAGLDLSVYKNEIIVHKAEGQPDIYEVNDGQSNNFEAADREAYYLLGYRIKRSFIDASIGDPLYVKNFLAATATDDNAYSAMTGKIIEDFGKDMVKLQDGIEIRPAEK